MNTYRAYVAILRAWGAPRSLLFGCLLALAVLLVSGETLPLPAFEQTVVLTNLAPPLTALLLSSALIDSTREMNRISQRPLIWLSLGRYALTQLAAIPVAVALTVAVDQTLYAAVALFVAGAALLVALLDEWYWPPILICIYGWLRFSQSAEFYTTVDVSPLVLVGAVLLGCAIYVVGSRLRARA